MADDAPIGNPVSGLLGQARGKANEYVDPVKAKVDKMAELLDGVKRTPFDPDGTKPVFIKGVDLSTPSGGPRDVPVSGNVVGGGANKTSKSDWGKKIEIISFGYVHKDSAKNFDWQAPL